MSNVNPTPDVVKAFSYAGFFMAKTWGQNIWTIMCAAGPDTVDGRSLKRLGSVSVTVTKRLTQAKNEITTTSTELKLSLPFTKRVDWNASSDEVLSLLWRMSYDRNWFKKNYFNNNDERDTLFQVDDIRDDLKVYRNSIVLPDSLKRKGESVKNTHLLPFYAVGDTPELCEAALNAELSASSPVVTAARKGLISMEQFHEYKTTPSEWVYPMFFSSPHPEFS